MKRDIETRADIDDLLTEFYKIVMFDGELEHHFVDLDLRTHLPVIADFWEKVLFGNPVYFGNPVAVHQILHSRSPLKPEHFVRWVEIFRQTVDRLYAGEIADAAKERAEMIGQSLNQRLNGGVQIQGSL